MDYNTMCDEIAYAKMCCIINLKNTNYIVDITRGVKLFRTKSDLIIILEIYNSKCTENDMKCIIENGNIMSNELIIKSSPFTHYFYFEDGNVLRSHTSPYYIYIHECHGAVNYGIDYNSVVRIMNNDPIHIHYAKDTQNYIVKPTHIIYNMHRDGIEYAQILDDVNVFTTAILLPADHSFFPLSFVSSNKEIIINSSEEFDTYLNENYPHSNYFDQNGKLIDYDDRIKWKFDE